MLRAAAALLALTLMLAGCGGGANEARRELRETAQRLDAIRSGNLTLKLLVLPAAGTNGRIGFELRGPFQLRPNALPVADITYTQFAGPRRATARFVSTGSTAYAVSGGRKLTLAPAATEEISKASASLGGSGGAGGGLRIDTWLKDPHVSDGGHVGGADTDRVSADLDVVNAANGLLGLVRQLGRDTPTIAGTSADQLRKAVTSSHIDVWTGKRDKLLRRLALNAELGFDTPGELKQVLGDIVGAKVVFELAIANPNRPIRIAP